MGVPIKGKKPILGGFFFGELGSFNSHMEL
jgi:hypothetical protein